jgi:cytochrome c peroxidase
MRRDERLRIAAVIGTAAVVPVALALSARAQVGPVVASKALTTPDDSDRQTVRVPLRGLDLFMAVPDDNPQTRAKIALGRRLFFERRLSRDGSISCSTCHDPVHAFASGRRVAIGIEGRHGTRNVPTIVNRGYGRSFFWDGRASSLEAQALEPIRNPLELGSRLADVVQRLRSVRSYRAAFRAAFAADPNERDLARALASFVRTIASGDSSFDRAMDRQPHALSSSARSGLALFVGKANCWVCHRGPTLTDEQFHNTGVAWRTRRGTTAPAPSDPGRATVTGRTEDRGAFKTPTLREVARTAPYMHDGSFGTLEAVVEYYDRGGQPNPGLDERIRPLHLSAAEKRDLVAFLRALRGRIDYPD